MPNLGRDAHNNVDINVDINVENAPTLNKRHHSEGTSTNNVEIGQFKEVSRSELSNIPIHG
jgi:hypothetical protein